MREDRKYCVLVLFVAIPFPFAIFLGGVIGLRAIREWGISFSMKSLKNKYYAFRHGQSMANVKGIIISDPAVGTVKYGLTEEGRLQAKRGAAALADELEADALIYASDFRRAAETAEIVREMLGVEQIIFDERLRERFFGEWEGEPHEYYSKAWKRDAHDSNHEFNGVESTNAVRSRMWAVIQSLEKQHAGRTIILVSHGDPLMLLETAFLEMDPKNHRTLPYFETAGWRALNSCGEAI